MYSGRRSFLKNSALVSAGFLGLNNFAVNAATSWLTDERIGFGPLINEGEILQLPAGFSAKVISSYNNPMHNGLVVPGTYDGMGAFATTNGKVILVRNHELSPGAKDGPYGTGYELITKVNREQVYDFGGGKNTCVGGTTTVVYDEIHQKVELEYLSLTGTVRNCAGGVTPWNSWITCEETDLRKGDEKGTLERDHGYNFEVKATTEPSLQQPVPLKAMGRFVHEAVTVDPTTGIIYQTEDSGDGVFYRFIPNEYGNLEKGGRLQCLALREWKSADTRNWEKQQSNEFPKKSSSTFTGSISIIRKRRTMTYGYVHTKKVRLALHGEKGYGLVRTNCISHVQMVVKTHPGKYSGMFPAN